MKTALTKLREQAGISLRDLSKFSGVAPSIISRLETGGADIKRADAQTVYMLAHALGTTVEKLLEMEEIVRETAIRNLLFILKRIPNRQKTQIRRAAHNLSISNEDYTDPVMANLMQIVPDDLIDEISGPVLLAVAETAYSLPEDSEGMPLPKAVGKSGANAKKYVIRAFDRSEDVDTAVPYLQKAIRICQNDGFYVDPEHLLQDLISWKNGDKNRIKVNWMYEISLAERGE